MFGNTPIPWWQAPGQQQARTNLEQGAPAGYEYDPVKMQYTRTPTSAGQRAKQFTDAAMPSSLQSLLGGVGGGTGAGASGSPTGAFTGGSGTGTGTGTNSGVARPQLPDTTAATNATFAAAKDRAGAMTRASLSALNGELGATGMIGSGAQVQGTKDLIQAGAGEVGQVSRDLATTRANQAADFERMRYSGDVTMRGQDIQHQEANAQLALASQDRQMKLLSLMMQMAGGQNASLIY